MMLSLLSLVYFVMPPGLVPIFLLMREGRLPECARIGATQTIADHVLTMLLIVIWPGAWAIVLPKLLTAPLWTCLARRARSWRIDPRAGLAPMGSFRNFGIGILASEILAACRMQADKLLVGFFFGTKMLGVYYFAFNAGLGISQSLASAFGIVLLPHLSRFPVAARRTVEAARVLLWAMLAFGPVVLAQSLLAPQYVPIIFGEEWAEAGIYVSVMALAGLPLLAGAALSALYRANGTTYKEASLATLVAIACLAGLAMGCQLSLLAACAGYLAGLALTLLPAAASIFLRFVNPKTILVRSM